MTILAAISIGLAGLAIGSAAVWWTAVRTAKRQLGEFHAFRGDVDNRILTLLAYCYLDNDERRRSLLLGRITHAFGTDTVNLVLARVPQLPH